MTADPTRVLFGAMTASRVSPERFVQRSVPTYERTRREEPEEEKGDAERYGRRVAHVLGSGSYEVAHTGYHIEEQHERIGCNSEEATAFKTSAHRTYLTN